MVNLREVQNHISDDVVSEAAMSFRSKFRGIYSDHVMIGLVGAHGPLQSLLGHMVQRGLISESKLDMDNVGKIVDEKFGDTMTELNRLRRENASLKQTMCRISDMAEMHCGNDATKHPGPVL